MSLIKIRHLKLAGTGYNFLLVMIFVLLSLNMLMISNPVLAENESINREEEMITFLDGVLKSQLGAYNIPGATFALVKEGKLIYAKGYGYADLDERIPVNADTTVFRTGSVSKLFTWTAVMQLVEEGKLDLDEDVNTYLKGFKIPDTYSEPITLRHLLSHTPGFEDEGLRTFVSNYDNLVSLEEYLAETIPERVYPPGEIVAYSNYGASLAGHIIAEVSGIPFTEYIRKNIFEPLSMDNSAFVQPLSDDLEKNMAEGYTYQKGIYKTGDFEIAQTIPAGSMSSTATDMAKFMIAHLQKGKYNNNRILNEKTAEQMHSQLFTQDPRITGWAHGFMEMKLNNKRIILHGGDTFLFHAGLYLIPEENIGIFVSYNSMGGNAARHNLIKAFMDQFYPVAKPTQLKPPADFKERAEKYKGSYIYSRNNYSTIEKITSIQKRVKISVTKDDLLQLNGYRVTQWVEKEPMVFRRKNSDELLIFEKDKDGNIKYGYQDNDPLSVLIKLPWYGDLQLHLIILIISEILFVSMIIYFIIRKIKVGKGELYKDKLYGERLIQLLSFLVSISGLLFPVGLIYMLNYLYAHPDNVPLFGKIMLIVPNLILLFTIGLIILVGLAWKDKSFNVKTRIYYTILTIFSILFCWLLYYWNFIGFNI